MTLLGDISTKLSDYQTKLADKVAAYDDYVATRGAPPEKPTHVATDTDWTDYETDLATYESNVASKLATYETKLGLLETAISDLTAQLPGEGVWYKATVSAVDYAVAKTLRSDGEYGLDVRAWADSLP